MSDRPELGADVTTCPSYSAELAESVIGVIGPAGTVGYLSAPIAVTRGLLDGLADATGQLLDARYRFSGPCRQGGCASWLGHHCGAIAEALTAAPTSTTVSIGAPLAPCAIRSSCQWWAEHGRRACAVCPAVTSASLDPTPEHH